VKGPTLKLLICVVPPKRLEQIKKALWECGVRGVTVTEASGYGYQRVQVESIQGSDYKVQYQPRVRLEVAVTDEDLERVTDLFLDNARTGRIGDGKLFVLPLEDAVRVRTGERGESAL
jgi:nitrogen regulatory protein PII